MGQAEEMTMDEEFLPDTLPEAQEPITQLRAMIADPRMDQVFADVMNNSVDVSKGIAAFLASIITQAQDTLNLPPEVLMGPGGVVANLTLDAVKDAIDLQIPGSEDPAMPQKTAEALMELLEESEEVEMPEGEEGQEGMPPKAPPAPPQGMGPAMTPKPVSPQGIPSPFAGARRG